MSERTDVNQVHIDNVDPTGPDGQVLTVEETTPEGGEVTPSEGAETLGGEVQQFAGKFNSVEDLEAAYKALESRLGSPPAAEGEGVETGDAPHTPVSLQSLEKYSQHFSEHGSLTEDHYTELEGMGFSRELVDAHLVQAQQAQLGMQQTQAQFVGHAISGVEGGVETYQAMLEWAKNSLSADEIQAYNQATSYPGNPAQAKLAVDGLFAKYRSAMGGVDGGMIRGDVTHGGPAPFRSHREAIEAQKDPRYQENGPRFDPAFKQDVLDRYKASLEQGIF